MKLSVIVITYNEEKWIDNCLRSVRDIADEIIIVDCGSQDKTLDICLSYQTKIFHHKWQGYSAQKNFALSKTAGDWIFFIDADERLSKELKSEMLEALNQTGFPAYEIPRRNILLGQVVYHGGWAPDHVTRLAMKESIIGWKGNLHEELVTKGKKGKLNGHLYHLSHRGINWMLEKSSRYTPIEARLRFESGHPKVTWWRILRVMLTEFWHRLIVKYGWRDGEVGWIESISQAFNIFLIYVHLWEMQKGKSMEEIYLDLDEKMAKNGF